MYVCMCVLHLLFSRRLSRKPTINTQQLPPQPTLPPTEHNEPHCRLTPALPPPTTTIESALTTTTRKAPQLIPTPLAPTLSVHDQLHFVIVFCCSVFVIFIILNTLRPFPFCFQIFLNFFFVYS